MDVIALEKHADMVVTDSGGVQKEAFFFENPCLILRSETEWVETVEAGWNVVVGSDHSAIINKTETMQPPFQSKRTIFGDGNASEQLVQELDNKVQARRTRKSM